MAPPSLQAPLLPCLDNVNNGYPTIITFEATFANGSSSPLSLDARRNKKNLRPKEIPNTGTIIQTTQEVTIMAQLQFLLLHPIVDPKGAPRCITTARAANFQHDRPTPISPAPTQQM